MLCRFKRTLDAMWLWLWSWQGVFPTESRSSVNFPLFPLLFLNSTACMAATIHYYSAFNEFFLYLHFSDLFASSLPSESRALSGVRSHLVRSEISPDWIANNIYTMEISKHWFFTWMIAIMHFIRILPITRGGCSKYLKMEGNTQIV